MRARAAFDPSPSAIRPHVPVPPSPDGLGMRTIPWKSNSGNCRKS